MNLCSRVEKKSYIKKGLRLNCVQAYNVCGFHCDKYVLAVTQNELVLIQTYKKYIK